MRLEIPVWHLSIALTIAKKYFGGATLFHYKHFKDDRYGPKCFQKFP